MKSGVVAALAIGGVAALFVGAYGYFHRWYIPEPDRSLRVIAGVACNENNGGDAATERVFERVDRKQMTELDRTELEKDVRRGKRGIVCRSIDGGTSSRDVAHDVTTITVKLDDVYWRYRFHETSDGWRLFAVQPGGLLDEP